MLFFLFRFVRDSFFSLRESYKEYRRVREYVEDEQ